MSGQKRAKLEYSFFDFEAEGSTIRLHYNEGCQFHSRKQCDENPLLYAVKIEYMHADGKGKSNNSCFYAVGEKKTLLKACLRQIPALNVSRQKNIAEFIDCARSTHEVVLESTDRRAYPVHLVLDLEIKKKEFGNVDIPANIDRKLTPLIIGIVLDILKKWIVKFDYAMEENIVILTSTRDEQYSIHVICKNIVFPSMLVLHAFAREMKNKTDVMPPFNIYSSRIIDFSIYRKETTLRMMHFGKSLMLNQWDSVLRVPRNGVKTHPLRLLDICELPRNVVTILDQVIYASIGMDSEALKVINCYPRIPLENRAPTQRVCYTEKRAKRPETEMLELDTEGKDVLDKIYSRLEDMVYWPRRMLSKAHKNMVTHDSIVLDNPLEPVYIFEYSDFDEGVPCFRDTSFFQPRCLDPLNANLPYDRHHKSPVSLYVYANGNVCQSCWVHQEGYRLYKLGNYLNQVDYNLSDLVDICVKQEVDDLGVDILKLMD